MALFRSITYLFLAALDIEAGDLREVPRMALLQHAARALALDLDYFQWYVAGLRDATAQAFEAFRTAFVTCFYTPFRRTHVGEETWRALKPLYAYAEDFHASCCRFLLNDDLHWYDSAWCLIFLACQPIAVAMLTCLIKFPDAFHRLVFGFFPFEGLVLTIVTALWAYCPFLAAACEKHILGPTAWEELECTDVDLQALANFGIHDHRNDQMRKLFWCFMVTLLGLFFFDLRIVWTLSCIVLPMIAYTMRSVLCMDVAVMDHIDQRAELRFKLDAMRERVVGTMKLKRRVFEADRSLETERTAHLRSVRTFQEYRDHFNECIEQETAKARRSNADLQSARADLVNMQDRLNESIQAANNRTMHTESKLHRTRYHLHMTREALRLRLQEWSEANERVASLERQATARESAHKLEVEAHQEDVEKLKTDTEKLMRQIQDINLEYRAESCLLEGRICAQNMKLASRESTIRTNQLTISEQQAIMDTLKASHAEEVSDLEQQNTDMQRSHRAEFIKLQRDFCASTRKQEYKIDMLQSGLEEQRYCCEKLSYALDVSRKSDKASAHLLGEYAKRVVALKKKLLAQEQKLDEQRAETKAVETLWENARQEVKLARALIRERNLLQERDERIQELEARVEDYEPLEKENEENEEQKEGPVQEPSESDAAPISSLGAGEDNNDAAAVSVEGEDISEDWEGGYLGDGSTKSGEAGNAFSMAEGSNEGSNSEPSSQAEGNNEGACGCAVEEWSGAASANVPSREEEEDRNDVITAAAAAAVTVEGEDISHDWQGGNLSDGSTISGDSGYALSMDDVSDQELQSYD